MKTALGLYFSSPSDGGVIGSFIQRCVIYIIYTFSTSIQITMHSMVDSPANDDLVKALDAHIGNLNAKHTSWTIKRESNGDRGICASRDIDVNETIFFDRPLIIGPIAGAADPLTCVVCYRNVTPTDFCPTNCGFPMCAMCPKRDEHLRECQLIRSWSPKRTFVKQSTAINGLAAIRSLLLSDSQKHLLRMLQSNHSIEDEMIEAISEDYATFPTDVATVELLKLATSVRNTNAFRVFLTSTRENKISVTGLYPLTGLMNHSCVPNVRLSVNDQMIGQVIAARKINKSEQLFISYSQLLWCTSTRRAHLAFTKQFRCECDRCKDPLEFGASLAALNCLTGRCAGYVLPMNALALTGAWKCTLCNNVVGYTRIMNMNTVLAGILNKFLGTNCPPEAIMRFLQNRIPKIVPPMNQYTVELKLAVIWRLNCDGIEAFLTNLIGACVNSFLFYFCHQIPSKLQTFCKSINTAKTYSHC